VGDAEPSLQARIRSAVRQRESGDVAGARASLEELLPAAEAGSTFDWLFFAHSYADVQHDAAQELRWDLAALDALDHTTEDDVAREGVPGGRAGLLPSLHLNVADVCRRLGDDEQAQRHYERGARHLAALDDDTYGESIREAFRRFGERD
jgi:hypothetical protein